MDDNSSESPVDEHSEEMEGSPNDNDGLENAFHDQSPESGTDINLSTIGPDQQISSQSVDTLASNQQHRRASVSPTSTSTSEAMDTDQSEDILPQHLGTQDHSYPRQFSENSPILERTDIGSHMTDQSTSETNVITLESDYSPDDENFEISKPIASKRKKEWLENYFRESATENEALMSKLQPSKAAITPDCSRIDIITRENKETGCLEGPSLSSSKKRKIGSIDDQTPLVTHEVRSAVNMDLEATEFRVQSGRSDQSSMEMNESPPPSEQSSRGNDPEVPPQSKQATSSEVVPSTKLSEGDMDINPPYEERLSTSGHQPVAESNNSGYEVSTLIRDARDILLHMLGVIMILNDEKKTWDEIKKKFDDFFHSPCYDKEKELSYFLIDYVINWHNTLSDCASEDPEFLEFEFPQKKAFAILINVVATALIFTLSEWTSWNFDGIALNIKTHRNLYCYISKLWENRKTEEIQDEDSRNRVSKFEVNMRGILLRMDCVTDLFLMHLGKHASQAIQDKCKKSICNQDLKYLILKPS